MKNVIYTDGDLLDSEWSPNQKSTAAIQGSWTIRPNNGPYVVKR